MITNKYINFYINNRVIEILLLHWNNLGSDAGLKIANSLLKNKSLRVLDLSYNAIGSNEDHECTN